MKDMNPVRPLILIGGGGHCKSVIEAAESSGMIIRGILDRKEHVGEKVLGYEIIGTDDDILLFANDCDFIVTLGFIKNSAPRVRLHNLVENCGGRFATVIASTANVSRYAEIGDGTVVLHNAVVNAGAKIGRGCIINTLACVEHDVRVGDYCHLSTGSIVNGDCRIGSRSFIGSGTVVNNGISITDDVIVGSGSLVRKDLGKSGVYYGSPTVYKTAIL